MLKLTFFLCLPDCGGGNAISFYLLKDQESTQCNMNFPNWIFVKRSDDHGGGNVADVITEIDDDCHSSSDKRE